MSLYQQRIRETLAQLGEVGAADPRHIEGYMRVEHSTLDGLSPAQFKSEVALSLRCVRLGGVQEAELCARSFGL